MNTEDKIITKLLDENIVTKSEMMEAIDRNAEKHAQAFNKSVAEVKDSIKEIKSSALWVVGLAVSILIGLAGLALHFIK